MNGTKDNTTNSEYGFVTLVEKQHYTTFTFSGGERHVQLTPEGSELLRHAFKSDLAVNINIMPRSANDIFDILLLNDIVKNNFKIKKRRLFMNYIPYARQDRATTKESPFSLRVFADVLNSCEFTEIWVFDPHSQISNVLIKNMINVDFFGMLLGMVFYKEKTAEWTPEEELKNVVLCSPDYGAMKKVESYAQNMGVGDVLVCSKKRNPATGHIDSIKIISDTDYSGKDVFIIDDICDGGRTFIEILSKTDLKEKAASVNLVVTHGIFSQGKQVLLDAGFDTVQAIFDWETKRDSDKGSKS